MLQIAVSCGVHHIIATPHANQRGRFENFYDDRLRKQFDIFRKIVKAERIPVQIYPGMEIMASYDMKEKIEDGRLIGLNHSRYYLVEFDFDESPDSIRQGLADVRTAGGVPLLAHPERYFCVQDYPILLYDWMKEGCLSQINKGSLFGKFGRRAYFTSQLLMEHDLVTCVASDAHSDRMRTPYMGDAICYISEQFGNERLYDLMEINPKRILKNESLDFHGRRPGGKPYLY